MKPLHSIRLTTGWNTTLETGVRRKRTSWMVDGGSLILTRIGSLRTLTFGVFQPLSGSFQDLKRAKTRYCFRESLAPRKVSIQNGTRLTTTPLDRAIRPYMPDSVNLSQSRSGQSDTIRSGQSDTIRLGQSDTIRNGSTCTNLDRVNLEFSYKETETTSETTSSETTDREKSFFPQTDFADAQCEPEPPIEIRVTPAPNQNTLVAQRSGSEGTSNSGRRRA